jgi:hypothetical protein
MRNPEGWDHVEGGVIWSPPGCTCDQRGVDCDEHPAIPTR